MGHKRPRYPGNPIHLPRGKNPVGRNDLCVCGSGEKFKKCCITKYDLPPATPVRVEAVKEDEPTSESSDVVVVASPVTAPTSPL